MRSNRLPQRSIPLPFFLRPQHFAADIVKTSQIFVRK